MRRGQRLLAIGGMLGALAASSCCILPLVLFSLGVSGAWIGNFTRLAPYQPFFVAATVLFLGSGYWLVYRSRTHALRGGRGLRAALAESCRQGKPHPRNDPRRCSAWPRLPGPPLSHLVTGEPV